MTGSLEKPKPSTRTAGSPAYLQRVQHSQFFGAYSVASALDLRLERDPEANRSTLSPCTSAAMRLIVLLAPAGSGFSLNRIPSANIEVGRGRLQRQISFLHRSRLVVEKLPSLCLLPG